MTKVICDVCGKELSHLDEMMIYTRNKSQERRDVINVKSREDIAMIDVCSRCALTLKFKMYQQYREMCEQNDMQAKEFLMAPGQDILSDN